LSSRRAYQTGAVSISILPVVVHPVESGWARVSQRIVMVGGADGDGSLAMFHHRHGTRPPPRSGRRRNCTHWQRASRSGPSKPRCMWKSCATGKWSPQSQLHMHMTGRYLDLGMCGAGTVPRYSQVGQVESGQSR